MSSGTTMRRVSLRNIAAHKVRLFLTVLAVVLGTAFVSGSMMFTNSLSSTFDEAISSSLDGVDVVVSPSGESAGTGIPVEMVDTLRNRADVDNANIDASQSVVLATEDAKAIQTGSGSSSIGIFYEPEQSVGMPYRLAEGELPEGTEEVLINQPAVEEYGFGIGDQLLVVDSAGRYTVTITGTTTLEEETSMGGIRLAMSEAAYTERYLDGSTVPTVILSGAQGTEPQELVDALTADLGPEYTIETGEALVEEMTAVIRDALSFIQYFLVAFGLIALLVGTFIIANTFSMIVAQRMREFALLRALGMSRKQLTASVVFEAIVVGLFGSALGVLGGMGLVAIISAVLNNFGMPMGGSLGLTPAAVITALVLGTVVTVISAWAPARRAGQVKPVEAMRAIESTTVRSMAGRTVIGGIVLVLGIALAVAGAMLADSSTSTRAILVGLGALAVVVGTFFFSPALSIPLVGGLGRIMGAPFGAVGRLSSTNSRRNPRRTATTAFALTLGIALVTAIGMLSATMKEAVSDLMEEQINADYVLTGPTNGSITLPREAATEVAAVDGVTSVATIGANLVDVDGKSSFAGGPHAMSFTADGNIGELIVAQGVEGSMDLTGSGFISSREFAEASGWELGGVYPINAMDQPVGEVELIGIYDQNIALGNFVVAEASFENTPVAGQSIPQLILVNGAEDVDQEQFRADIEAAVADFIVVQVKSSSEYAGETVQIINTMMNILYALLALAVIVAIIGIINTLALNVIERRQEIGMLRAVGTKRGQVRTMITLESVQIAIYGAIVGMLIGLGLGWAFVTVMSGEGLDAPATVPWGQLIWMLVGSAVVGVIAALWPAHKAAKTPPLEAITD